MHFLVGSNAEIGDNKHMEEASDVWLRNFDHVHSLKDKISGLWADAREEDAREGLAKDFSLVGRTISLIHI